MEKKKQINPIQAWWSNIKNTKKNYKKVRASPYASLVFALKIRKMILFPLIIYLVYMCVNMVLDYSGRGVMAWFGRIVMIGIFTYLVWKIYRTIPAAKKQIAYYRKYPHVINYCPTNVKEDIDDILEKVKSNKENLKEAENKNVYKKENTEGRKKESSTTSSTGN